MTDQGKRVLDAVARHLWERYGNQRGTWHNVPGQTRNYWLDQAHDALAVVGKASR